MVKSSNIKNYHIINTLDKEKKNNFKNRTLISVFVFVFYFVLIIFSFLFDNTQAKWLDGIIDSITIKGIFALLFIFLLYIPFCFAMCEMFRMIFKEYRKIPSIILLTISSFFYLAPSLFLIVSTYFNEYFISDGTDLNTNLFFVYFLYLTIFFSSIVLLVSANILLKKYNLLFFQAAFTLNFLLLLIPFGFLGFALIGILRGWTTILYLLIAVISTDVMCYISGMLFGKHKMAKVISPNKTWEGAIVGTILAILFLLIYCGLLTLDSTPITINSNGTNKIFDRNVILLWNISEFQTKNNTVSFAPLWIILFFVSLGLVVISILGDLLFSFIKRRFSIKDFGTALKSHGGFLDRFDSFIVTSSVYFIYTSIALGVFALSKNVNIIFGVPIF